MAVQNYVLLERIELNATTASVTFSNIPQTGYTDLKIVLSARMDAGSGGYQTYVRFNGDTASNYYWRNLLGTGSSSVSQNSLPDTGMRITMSDSSGDTASTFGNSELYIPNYKSSTQKSVSADGVSENNATAASTDLAAGLWTGTAAITSITIFGSGANLVSGSTFSLYGIANSSTTPVVAPKATGGNVIATDGTYWYHAFLSNGTFTPATALSCDVLQVAGGGGGGGRSGGGGGAGGLLALTSQSLTTTNYTVTIGAGGAGGPAAPGTNAATIGVSGSNTTFTGLTAAVGGGGGAARSDADGLTGGSGGGGSTGAGPGSGTSGQGYAGGAMGTSQVGSGGGGAGGVGIQGTTGTNGAAGGVGSNTYSSWATATTTGVGGYYAGGGGGGSNVNGSSGAGGSGGGGGGTTGNGAAGTTNTGGGGAGGNYNAGTGYTGGAGGSGIVIVRYTVA